MSQSFMDRPKYTEMNSARVGKTNLLLDEILARKKIPSFGD